MRRSMLIPAVLVALAMMPVGASAQGGLGAPDFKDRFTDEFDDPDFCGTGETVHVVERIVGNVWESDDGKMFKLAFSASATITYGDATILSRNAGTLFDVLIEGDDQDEAHTHQTVATGIRSFLRAPGQGIATIDHGNLEFIERFGEDHEFLGVEVLRDAGGHPDFYEPVWCEAAIDLLGIPAP